METFPIVKTPVRARDKITGFFKETCKGIHSASGYADEMQFFLGRESHFQKSAASRALFIISSSGLNPFGYVPIA